MVATVQGRYPERMATRTRTGEVTVWWIRRDVRLHDATALDAALRRGGPVVPVFVVD